MVTLGRSKLKIQAAAVCHMGKIRTNNEDNFFFDRYILKEDHQGLNDHLYMENILDGEPIFFGVFDGMGGEAKGERASYVVAEAIGLNYDTLLLHKQSPVDFALSCCNLANEQICQEMKTMKARMGTTVSSLIFHDDLVAICNIGDSPIFRLRRGVLEEIYEEHTERKFREALSENKTLKKRKYPLTQHLGIFPEEMLISPYINELKIKKNDWYIICSDGLTDMVDMSGITDIIEGNPSPENAAKELLAAALENGGRDNTTIILVKVVV